MAVGQARGVAMLAAAQRGVPCFDYTPQAVKKAVCGSGSADKGQVQRWWPPCSGLPEPPASDHAADAFAVAICHAGGRRRPRPASRPPRAARLAGAGRRLRAREASARRIKDRDLRRRGAGAPPRPRRRRGGRRLPARRLGRDAEVGAGARQTRPSCIAHLVARDDALSLYGFASEEERDLFLHLISVSGVGPKVAIAALSGGGPSASC